jgi:cytochrome c peroxidase
MSLYSLIEIFKTIKMKNIIILTSIFLFIFACKPEKDEFSTTPYQLKIPKGFPTSYSIPKDNPMTVEGVALGRYLYYDERLSGKAAQGKGMSCGTCHIQSHAFENGTGFGVGTTGVKTHHVMLPHINLLWNPGTFGWNGGGKTLEEIVMIVIPLESEINSTWPEAVAAIKNTPMYPPLFEKAFGTPEVTADRISKAIAQFIRTQISGNSKFDRMLQGTATFSDAERRGLVLFTTENGGDCFHCHGGSGNLLMTTHGFYNNAKDLIFDTLNDRYSITHKTSDIGAYKATTLRNIEYTGPYMHDGRFKTLDEVINFYSEGLKYSSYVHPLMHKAFPPYGTGVQLNQMQKADLKAFLLTLSDSSFINSKELSNPFK